jgi:hypothetical protein
VPQWSRCVGRLGCWCGKQVVPWHTRPVMADLSQCTVHRAQGHSAQGTVLAAVSGAAGSMHFKSGWLDTLFYSLRSCTSLHGRAVQVLRGGVLYIHLNKAEHLARKRGLYGGPTKNM